MLEGFPDAQLPVGIIWIDILPPDGERAARRSARILTDPRVRQFHDPHHRVGNAIAEGLLYEGGGPAWDIYLFYEKGGVWGDGPPRPTAWMHQLGGDRRADPAHLRTGGDLVVELRKAMEGLVRSAG